MALPLWAAMLDAAAVGTGIHILRRRRRGSLRLPVKAMAARSAWVVGALSQHEG